MKCEDSVDRTDHPSQHAISVNKLNTQEEWMEKSCNTGTTADIRPICREQKKNSEKR
jgi:peptidoglycan/xylan/chitin deacetylase (PgdA/CDA1 family)